MVTLYNKLNQPLPINITKTKSIHFSAKERKEVSFADFQAADIREKIDKGYLIVLRMEND